MLVGKPSTRVGSTLDGPGDLVQITAMSQTTCVLVLRLLCSQYPASSEVMRFIPALSTL